MFHLECACKINLCDNFFFKLPKRFLGESASSEAMEIDNRTPPTTSSGDSSVSGAKKNSGQTLSEFVVTLDEYVPTVSISILDFHKL